ncbi:hypothetical protein FRC18_005954 [Serendipita sp. 400]|nr:hypothetical protein FRC18_005954 [Serendipita sp. 400]
MLMKASQDYEQKRRGLAKKLNPTDHEKQELETARGATVDAEQGTAAAREKHDKTTSSALRNKIASQSSKSLDVNMKGQLDADITAAENDIKKLEKELEDVLKKSGVVTNIITNALGDTNDPLPQPTGGDSSGKSTTQSDSSTSFSAGGSTSWGLFSVDECSPWKEIAAAHLMA